MRHTKTMLSLSSNDHTNRLKINAILNLIRKGTVLVFPLITFPYISRILGVENLGKFNYSLSIVSYFVLFASLGIPLYSANYGAKIRDDKKRSDEFISDLFTISICTTIIAYLLFAIMIRLFPSLANYKALLMIQSILIVGTTMGMDWYFVIFEDYFYITIRVIAVQVISFVLIFALIHTKDDLYTYAWVYLFSQVGAGIVNLWIISRRTRLRIRLKSLREHLSPILTIFFLCVSSQIYINADMTMLGIMKGDYFTGLYSVSNKVYRVLKTLMAALYEAALPNLSNRIAKEGIDSFKIEINKLLNTILVFLMPAVCGVIAVAGDIIYIVGGKGYEPATSSLVVLGISLFFAVMSGVFMYAVLMPMVHEKVTMHSMTFSALLNIVLNIFFIPRFNIVGAAITTAISECVVFLWQSIYVSKYKIIKIDFKNIIQVAIGCVLIFVICYSFSLINFSFIAGFIIKVILSILAYGCVLIICKNKYVWNIIPKKVKE